MGSSAGTTEASDLPDRVARSGLPCLETALAECGVVYASEVVGG
jgi:hypothetical protein